MHFNLEPQQNLTTEKALQILKQQGIDMTPENAGQVIQFLYALAEIFYRQHPLK